MTSHIASMVRKQDGGSAGAFLVFFFSVQSKSMTFFGPLFGCIFPP